MGPTGVAGPLGHPGDEPLLFAGRLQPVTLVLVGVPVGAAHRHVVFVTLDIKDIKDTSKVPVPVKGQPPHLSHDHVTAHTWN